MPLKSKSLKVIFAGASASLMVMGMPATGHVHNIPVERSQISNDNHAMFAAAKRIGGLVIEDRSCLTLSSFLDAPAEYKRAPSYKTLTELYNSSAFSRKLMRDAADQGVEVCDMNLDERIGGVHIPSLNKIGIDFSRKDSLHLNMVYMAHEFAHYTQFLNGNVYFDANRNVYENQQAILSMETAAPVAEIIAMFMAEQNGDRSAAKAFPRRSDEASRYRHFKKEYKKAIKAGAGHDAAINTAAHSVWIKTFDAQSKLDHYNNALLTFTLLKMGEIEPHIAANYLDPKLADTIRGSGRLSDKIDFTRNASMPQGDALFGKNTRMKKIFEAVEWYRQASIYGFNNEWVIWKKQDLRAKGNKYVDANFLQASMEIRKGKSAESAIAAAVERRSFAENFQQSPYDLNKVSVTYR